MNLTEQERAKYRKTWENKDYRVVSPGMRHLAGALAPFGIEIRVLRPCIVPRKTWVERETGSRDNTNAAPISIRIIQRLRDLRLCRTISAGADQLGITVIQEALAFEL